MRKPAMLTRRGFTFGFGALAGAGALGLAAPRLIGRAAAYSATELSARPHAAGGAGRTVEAGFDAAPYRGTLPAFGGVEADLWSFDRAQPFPPVIRLRIGDTLVARVRNRIPVGQEELTIHWHGIRLPNAEDGVPYLTQPPIAPGADYTYRFTPPDTGTYWFHTHCNTVESIGRGLIGILIVEGDETRPYDGDHLLVLKDWRIGPEGFLPFMTDEGAATSGTFGTVRAVNGVTNPEIAVAAGGDVRLRIVNVDPTRVPDIGVEGAEAAVIAVDGAGIPPFPLKSWRMGPAMRLDLVVRAPKPGEVARVVDYFAPQPVELARLVGTGPMLDRGAFDPAPLVKPVIPEPNLADAVRLPFVFSATAAGRAAVDAVGDLPEGVPIGPLCLTERTFWAINKAPWPNKGHAVLPPPLAVLERGRSYVFELRNVTPRIHPIHIHGHTFRVVKSNDGPVVSHFADTVLVAPKERLEVAFVADNPGDWMFHCHIIEHQETGMMGYVKVA